MKQEKKMLFSLLVMVLVVVFSASTLLAATDTADIEAIVGTALEIEWNAAIPLAFGTFLPGTGGTIIIAPDGTVSYTVGITHLGGNYSAAPFRVRGVADTGFDITLPASVTITHSGGVETMTVDTFTSDPSGSGATDGSGNASVNVGATLNVADSQEPGTYSGNFDVTVNYQ